MLRHCPASFFIYFLLPVLLALLSCPVHMTAPLQLLQMFLWSDGGLHGPGSKVTVVSEVGVGEHGVLLPHRAEAFDGVHKFLVVHEL